MAFPLLDLRNGGQELSNLAIGKAGAHLGGVEKVPMVVDRRSQSNVEGPGSTVQFNVPFPTVA
jgi:hypothetical protein